MNVSARSYLTAGAAALSAAAIVMAPVQPLNSDLAAAGHTSVSDLAVGLAAAVTPINPIQNIIDVVNDSGASLEALLSNWAAGVYVDGTFPFPPNTGTNIITGNGNLGWRTGGYATGVGLPILNQFLSNVLLYLSELPDIGGILGQAFGNIGNAVRAPFVQGVNQPGRLSGLAAPLGVLDFNQNVNAIPYISVPGIGTFSQRDIGALLPVLAAETYAALKPVLDFATTPISGLLAGAVGPIVGPALAVVNSLSNTFALLQESDFGGALTELVNIPTNAIGAFLNGGQILDLTGLLTRLDVPLPSTITSVGLQLGGLLSPGGVALDGLATEASLLGASVTVTGLPVGPIGALSTLANYVARSMVLPTPVETVGQEAGQGVAAARKAASAAAATPAPVNEAAAAQSITEVVPADEPGPAPKRERRGAPARNLDTRAPAGSVGAADSDDAKPSRASRRAG